MSFQYEKSELQPSSLPTREAKGFSGNPNWVNCLSNHSLLLSFLGAFYHVYTFMSDHFIFTNSPIPQYSVHSSASAISQNTTFDILITVLLGKTENSLQPDHWIACGMTSARSSSYTRRAECVFVAQSHYDEITDSTYACFSPFSSPRLLS